MKKKKMRDVTAWHAVDALLLGFPDILSSPDALFDALTEAFRNVNTNVSNAVHEWTATFRSQRYFSANALLDALSAGCACASRLVFVHAPPGHWSGLSRSQNVQLLRLGLEHNLSCIVNVFSETNFDGLRGASKADLQDLAVRALPDWTLTSRLVACFLPRLTYDDVLRALLAQADARKVRLLHARRPELFFFLSDRRARKLLQVIRSEATRAAFLECASLNAVS